MRILIVDPFLGGSHQQWAQGFKSHSRHQVEILGLPGRFWKWHMQGGVLELAEKFLRIDYRPDLILATDMLDLALFLSMTRSKSSGVATAVYFHENQLSYPWSKHERAAEVKRKHYGFINLSSALCSDRVFFNSKFHRESFLTAAEQLLKQAPDSNCSWALQRLEQKSEVLPLALELSEIDQKRQSCSSISAQPNTLLWNHRWEQDKNPEEFFSALEVLKQRGYNFKLVVVGEQLSSELEVFSEAKKRFSAEIRHWGYLQSREDYLSQLLAADLLPVTSLQEFFGASVVEAVYAGAMPILPRRLSYPELIPKELHQEVFYDNFEQLVLKLEAALSNRKFDSSSLQKALARYSWENQIANYDDCLQALLERSSFS